MCGIAGFLDPALAAQPMEAANTLAAMRAAIAHRGPDDFGQEVCGDVGLAMQRLSIVDIEGGHQPMSSPTGQVKLVFNGEIYNHADLRAELKIAGRSFSSHCDTEVVLAQYERYGLEGLQKLNGMFAIAIWDQRTQELHLIRDRMGVKPLYYFFDGNRLFFASEIKAILASGRVDASVNKTAMWDFLTYRYVPAPQTIWNQIYKLPPAHSLTLSSRSRELSPTRYWDSPYARQGEEESNEGHVAQFSDLFEDAVNRRMLADVPVGVFLSGGLDSSAIISGIDRSAHPRVKTFAVGVEGAANMSDVDHARQVAQHLGTEHHEVVLSKSDFIDEITKLPFHTDEPLADLTCVPVLALSRAARKSVKVVLSGEGSDEILGGYTFDSVQQEWDAIAKAAQSRASASSTMWTTLKARLGIGSRSGNDAALAAVDQRLAQSPLHITNYLTSQEKQDMFTDNMSERDSLDVLKSALQRVHAQKPLHQSLYLYSQDWLVENLLMKADKMTMAESLELRTPFLDYRLVEWAARAPLAAKLRPLPGGKYETKAVLRDYARSSLPSDVLNRPKQGFPVPFYEWLSGPLKEFATDNLTGTGSRLTGTIDPKAVHTTLQRGTHSNASPMERHRLWNLLILELWMKAWA